MKKKAIIDSLTEFILDDHYDFEIEDGGGSAGENVYVSGMEFKDLSKFKNTLEGIIKGELLDFLQYLLNSFCLSAGMSYVDWNNLIDEYLRK